MSQINGFTPPFILSNDASNRSPTPTVSPTGQLREDPRSLILASKTSLFCVHSLASVLRAVSPCLLRSTYAVGTVYAVRMSWQTPFQLHFSTDALFLLALFSFDVCYWPHPLQTSLSQKYIALGSREHPVRRRTRETGEEGGRGEREGGRARHSSRVSSRC